MKMKEIHRLFFALIALGVVSLTGCATDEYGGGGADYSNPDPLSQQIEMQERMSRVTRELQPF